MDETMSNDIQHVDPETPKVVRDSGGDLMYVTYELPDETLLRCWYPDWATIYVDEMGDWVQHQDPYELDNRLVFRQVDHLIKEIAKFRDYCQDLFSKEEQ